MSGREAGDVCASKNRCLRPAAHDGLHTDGKVTWGDHVRVDEGAEHPIRKQLRDRVAWETDEQTKINTETAKDAEKVRP